MTDIIDSSIDLVRSFDRVRKGVPALRRLYTEYGFRFDLSGWGLGTKQIAGKIAKDCLGGRFRPDTIVQIVPGGLAIGALFASNYASTIVNPSGKFPRALQITPIHCNDGGSTVIKFDTEELDFYKRAFRGCNVLIVDGEAFTGRTLAAAKCAIQSYGVVEVRTAVIYQRTNISFTADYVAERRNADQRMPKPWMLEEHIYRTLFE